MKIIEPSAMVLTPIDEDAIVKHIELCGRTCYKSEEKITPTSASNFVKNIIGVGHLSVLEHFSITVRAVCDRGVSHEIVRHRIASYSQESTRFCNYSAERFNNELTFILPCWFSEGTKIELLNGTGFRFNEKNPSSYHAEYAWYTQMQAVEELYQSLTRNYGWSAQQARSVLPNSVKTEIVMTMNLRSWLHFFDLRLWGKTGSPHPQMKELAELIYTEFHKLMPTLFA